MTSLVAHVPTGFNKQPFPWVSSCQGQLSVKLHISDVLSLMIKYKKEDPAKRSNRGAGGTDVSNCFLTLVQLSQLALVL